ncbi:dihydrodipicolinate synthase family protein [Mucilaginibacter boryungensis]|uniref:Dihydrodipicolinate synthase family protein n=1 Tax=Mucilaginibacter boryungensis TaxID=768480 RepID=A0ABR9XE20_9SPHI|nr:dihydrodipicolinate synthase family protein [Mucilaginibacter boryungensis]MBE9665506.1 dihydrodipicolinate synthase family protein [Mucilaginibacter boryungensis]
MKTLNPKLKQLLMDGAVIPAHPLVLNSHRQLDEFRQRRLTRYYMASGAGGVAVAVHTTQFEIRDPQYNLFEKVLSLAADEINRANLDRPFIKVAGICGSTQQAVKEAEIAVKYGYDIGLLSLSAFKNHTEDAIIEHVRTVAEIIPVFGFYLQPAVGGRLLSYEFWKAFAEVPNVQAIKIAAFNRYQTIDVVRAVCTSGRSQDIALYTGNDDNIIPDLLTTYTFKVGDKTVSRHFNGGLLGHWAFWTHRAVELLAKIKEHRKAGSNLQALLTDGIAVTDVNAAAFDPQHQFTGCISGIHEILRRQGLLEGIWCLSDHEALSPGQMEEIDRVYENYPHLNDDQFVKAFLQEDKG